MKKNHCYEFAEEIFQPFIEQLNDSYNNEFKNRAEIFDILDYIFFKWYTSPYFNNVFLTPYRMIDQYICDFTEKTPQYRFVLKHSCNKGIINFKIKKYNYSIKDHIIVKDLKNFVENGALYSVCGIQCLKDKRNKFSLFTKDYINFLYEIALKLGFLDKLDSIYVEKEIYAPNKNIEAVDNHQLIYDICSAASELVCDKFTNLLYSIDTKLKEEFADANDYEVFFEKAFDNRILYEIIKCRASVHDLQISFLDVFDISVDNIISKKIYELNREELFYIRLYYWLGKKIEKYFIIPFSQYLNIFMPFYQKRYNINLSLKEYFYNEHFKNESTLEYTSSCGFQLTEFGKEILDINAEDEFKKFFNTVPLKVVLYHIKNQHKENNNINLKSNKVLKLKIQNMEDRDNNIIIEVVDNITLSYLHKEICLRFFEPVENRYSFYWGENRSPFTEYPSYIKNITSNCNIKEILNRKNKKSMLIIQAKSSEIKYLIEFLYSSNPEEKTYPYLVETGKTYKDIIRASR